MPEEKGSSGFWAAIAIIAIIIVPSLFYDLGARIRFIKNFFYHKLSNYGFSFREWLPDLILGTVLAVFVFIWIISGAVKILPHNWR